MKRTLSTRTCVTCGAAAALVSVPGLCLAAVDSRPAEEPAAAGAAPASEAVFIREYRVAGVVQLSAQEIGEAVYPFLGPGRTTADVEGARSALEQVYRAKGFQAVTVEVPEQTGRGGIIVLKAVEAKVGRLRVKGSRFFSLRDIKRQAPSIAEGKVPNFNEITRDIVALNTVPDRRVTPTLRPGVEPGTVDIDLEVKDTFPLHGSVELNNRASANTTDLRLNASINYQNLWQLGHAVGLSFQVAPEDPDDAKVISGYYLARFPNLPSLSLILQGTKQDSNVSTLGGIAVAGRGEIVGARAVITLPPAKDFYHSVSLGVDYKHFEEDILLGLVETQSPITYYPLSATYNASWASAGKLTELNAGVVFNLRGTGSDRTAFENKRFNADGNFFYLRGDLSHERDLPGGFQVYAKVQGQASAQPLINSEQFSGGGLGTVRGYLESEVVGDSALFGTLELHSPSVSQFVGNKVLNEWRFYVFGDGGGLWLNDPLPEQERNFELASYGAGSRIRLLEYLNGSIDAGVPLLTQGLTKAHDVRLTFRVWGDF